MGDSKALFCSSKSLEAREWISSKLMDNLGKRSQKLSSFVLHQFVITSIKPGFDKCIIHRKILFSHLPLQVSLAKFSLQIRIVLWVSYRRALREVALEGIWNPTLFILQLHGLVYWGY